MAGVLAVLVYIGCYTDNSRPEGLFAVEVSKAGEIKVLSKHAVDNAIYLARSPDGERVYSCDSTGIVALSAKGGNLVVTDKLDLGLKCVCHISLSADGKKLFFADYAAGKAGSVEVKDGRFGKCVVHTHEGAGPNKPRQNSAHCHQALPTPDAKGYAVVDLGIDSLVEYVFAADGGDSLDCVKRVFSPGIPGAGPRHLVFHPSGRMAFLVSELYNKLETLSWSPAEGFGKVLSRVDTLQSGGNGRGGGLDLAAAVRMTPDSKRVVMSNRGENSLVVYDFDSSTGALSFKSRTFLPGSWPRDFAFVSDTLAVVAMERSGEIHSLGYDPATGSFKVLSTLGGFFRPVAVLP